MKEKIIMLYGYDRVSTKYQNQKKKKEESQYQYFLINITEKFQMGLKNEV